LSPERDEDPRDNFDDEPRSIFSALWFRVVLVVLVLGVVGAVALPYLLDVIAPSAPRTARKPARQEARATPPPAVATPAVTPVAPPPAAAAPEPTPPVAAAPAPPPAPAPAPTRVAATPPAAAPAPAAVRSAPEAPKPEVKKDAPPKKDAVKAVAAAAKPAAITPKTSAAKATSGGYWVQVGAFRDAEAARRVADGLRSKKFPVDESVRLSAASAPLAAPSDTDRYSVVVSGRSTDEIRSALTAKSLRAEGANGVWTIEPSMPLADAVALSRDLAVDGLTVQVRRAGSPAATRPAANPTTESLHRVRVGPYPDRPAAVAVVRQLEGVGYKPFIARGSE